MRIAFDVAGLPAPEGNLRMSRAGRAYYPNGSDLRAWRHAIATEARAAAVELLDGAIELRLVFRRPRPASHYRADGLTLRPSAPAFPATRPDLSKLVRAAEDALIGVAYRDDSQIVDLVVRKRYAEPDQQPGVAIEVSERIP